MENRDLQQLLDRINQEPSILFLGQNYLASKTGKNPFFQKVNQELCSGKLSENMGYSDIWGYLGKNEAVSLDRLTQIEQIILTIPEQKWLRKVLELRWSTVFTSSIDDLLTRGVGVNFGMTSIVGNDNTFKRKYTSKRERHCVYLFGRLGEDLDHVPTDCSRSAMRRYMPQVSNKLNWITDEIIPYYGVLVIDGWNPEHDWLDDRRLLENLFKLPHESVYLFGANNHLLENELVTDLIDAGIMIAEPMTLAQVLDESGFFVEEDEDSEWISLPDEYEEPAISLTLRIQKNDYNLQIPISEVNQLDSRIILLNDDMEIPARIVDAERPMRFTEFLTQQGFPLWRCFNKRVNFYFDRDVDHELLSAVNKELQRESNIGRRLILLDGPSNSGKTMTLANLAMTLKFDKKYPVFFISGLPTQTAQNNFVYSLKKFIQCYFNDYRTPQGGRIEKVVVIWDGNNSMDSDKQYHDLRKALIECNVLVVGSCYRRNGSKDKMYMTGTEVHVPLKSALSSDEESRLGDVIKTLGGEHFSRFQAVRKRGLESDQRRHVHQSNHKGGGNQSPFLRNESRNLLVILQRLFEFQYNEEYRQVNQLLLLRQHRETIATETSTQEALDRFSSEFYETYDMVISKGIAANWQLKLQEWLSKHDETKTEEEKLIDEDKKEKFLQLENSITAMNSILAIAGQFSVSLPLVLLLRLIQDQKGAKREFYGSESRFLVEVLQEDSLIESFTNELGEVFISFRHSVEAENYLSNRFKDNERKKKEVELLCKLIEKARFDIGSYNYDPSAYHVLNLVRQFGPNSKGKPSDQFKQGSYNEYAEYLVDIANHLIKNAAGNPEATLVYCHFIRESENSGSELLQQCRDRLLDAIRNIEDVKDSRQYCRLLVELCANLVSSQRFYDTSAFNMDNYNEIHKWLNKAISVNQTEPSGAFSTNNILDIWLNAFLNFARSFSDEESRNANERFKDDLASTIEKIDLLLDTSAGFESEFFLDKIYDVYNYASNDKALEKLADSLKVKNNDTYLFLIGRKLWLTAKGRNSEGRKEKRKTSIQDLVKHDLYMIPDAPLVDFKVTNELREAAIEAAKQVIVLFEEPSNKLIIERSQSARCLAMLIRSKWISYTHHFPLEEKQRPNLTREKWDELGSLCSRYIEYEKLSGDLDRMDYKPAYFIRAMYLWTYSSDIKSAREIFKRLRNRSAGQWVVDRVILCQEGTHIPRQFLVDVVRLPENNNLVARISAELNSEGKTLTGSVHHPYNIYISNYMLEYLFGKITKPKPRNNISKPCTLCFSFGGVKLGPVDKFEEGE